MLSADRRTFGFGGHAMLVWLQGSAGHWALPPAHTTGPGLPQGMVTMPLPWQWAPSKAWKLIQGKKLLALWVHMNVCSLGSPLTASSRQRGNPSWHDQVQDQALNHQFRQGEVPRYTKWGSCPALSSALWGRGGFQVLNTICLLLNYGPLFQCNYRIKESDPAGITTTFFLWHNLAEATVARDNQI